MFPLNFLTLPTGSQKKIFFGGGREDYHKFIMSANLQCNPFTIKIVTSSFSDNQPAPILSISLILH